MKRKYLLLLDAAPVDGGNTPTATPAPASAPPPAAAVVMAGTKTEDQIRVEGELQQLRDDLTATKNRLATTEQERKEREVSICELQDKLEATKKEKRALEDAIKASAKKPKTGGWMPLIGSED